MSDTAPHTTTSPTMESGRTARPTKIATVEEIAAKLGGAQAVFVTEYRGLSVKQLADVRNALRPVGAEHVVYKNTLARIAARDAGLYGLESVLVGPTALTFVTGDIAGAAKALRESSKAMPAMVVKGGMLGGVTLSAADVNALADLPSREELLAKIAGAFQAPLVKTAGLLSALPRKFAYGLQALIEKQAA
jgi:large subunit ribosomal protein L10